MIEYKTDFAVNNTNECRITNTFTHRIAQSYSDVNYDRRKG